MTASPTVSEPVTFTLPSTVPPPSSMRYLESCRCEDSEKELPLVSVSMCPLTEAVVTALPAPVMVTSLTPSSMPYPDSDDGLPVTSENAGQRVT